MIVEFKKDTLVPPTVITVSNRTYAVKGSEWIEIKLGTQYKDVKFILPPKVVTNINKNLKNVEIIKIDSSNKKIKYTIELFKDDQNKILKKTCTCPAFKFRRTCKHIKNL